MDWKDAIREIAEEIIHTIEQDEKEAWDIEDERHLVDEFPETALRVVEINGEKHIIGGLFIIDGALPSALKYEETDSQFELPPLNKWVYEKMLNGLI